MSAFQSRNMADINLLNDNTTEASPKNKAVAFVNWAIPRSGGGMFRGSKGFPLFQNPEYPNQEEDALIELCRKHNGYVEVTMKCRICLNEKRQDSVMSIDDLILD